MTSFSGCLSKFQSTLSVRRATHVVDLGPVGVDISIHALRKESDKPFAKKFRWNAISIHALRKESDTGERRQMAKLLLFQSTLSVRRATILYGDTHDSSLISIHALRKESDISCVTSSSRCGRFQSTLSVRRATARDANRVAGQTISIHALRKESDAWKQLFVSYGANFNPRSP